MLTCWPAADMLICWLLTCWLMTADLQTCWPMTYFYFYLQFHCICVSVPYVYVLILPYLPYELSCCLFEMTPQDRIKLTILYIAIRKLLLQFVWYWLFYLSFLAFVVVQNFHFFNLNKSLFLLTTTALGRIAWFWGEGSQALSGRQISSQVIRSTVSRSGFSSSEVTG